MMVMNDLKKLENDSIYILREAYAQFKNIVVLWSTGKDSTTTLGLCKKAFDGKIPFPVVHIDTGYKFDEMYRFRDRIADEWGFDLHVIRDDEALKRGMGPDKGKLDCCDTLKTKTLKRYITDNKIEAVIVSIRRDEHGIRAKERVFSPRDKNFRWAYKEQDPEMWDIYFSQSDDKTHVRIHPILEWFEIDTWKYMKQENLPINPLYFAKDGKRYRSLGCYPCTVPVESNATNVDEMISELDQTDVSERSGRAQDKERAYAMQKLRSLGYM
jgi:sulfate adenylyltransferase subunit 2